MAAWLWGTPVRTLARYFARGSATTILRTGRLALALSIALGGAFATLQAMPAPAPGLIETGAPAFEVSGADALGLSAVPTDIQLLPDGRILVVAQHEIAFSDGGRWETFHQIDNQNPIFNTVVVDEHGTMFAGGSTAISRLELLPGDRWQLVSVKSVPAEGTVVYVANLPNRWLWYNGGRTFVSWRPGQQAVAYHHNGAIARIIGLGDDIYVAAETVGGLFRVDPQGDTVPVLPGVLNVSEAVTAAASFSEHQLLLGTISAGLELFDGQTFQKFETPGLPGKGHRVTEICRIDDQYFAVAIDTVGIVFIDRAGKTVQVLDRSLDHRLGRVRRMVYSPNGVLWALLNDGLARVQFPSAISNYNPLIASGLAYAEPLRHEGKLWILADGRAMRGVYSSNGLLERFEDDTPVADFLFTLTEVDGHLFAGADGGLFEYVDSGWKMIFSGVPNVRVGAAPFMPGAYYYVGRGECGLLRPAADGYEVVRTPVPGLGDNYKSVAGADGVVWLELGISRVGRLEYNAGQLHLDIFGPESGLADGWMEIYKLDGIVRFHVDTHVYQFDSARRRFVEDDELRVRLPDVAIASGRPVTDRQGRIWYTTSAGINRVIDHSPEGRDAPIPVPYAGFGPTGYTLQDDGVAWMFARGRLARMDLRVPSSPSVVPKALITSVQFSASGRQQFSPNGRMDPLPYADNSLVIHFSAPANPFTSPVTFEVMLEGAGSQWVSTGTQGSAVYNRLKEGEYNFRVRPVVSGNTPGGEAHLQFTIQPPWYRTHAAWTLYIIGTLALLGFVSWFSSFLQRRENERLELLVAGRTTELNATNEQLNRKIDEATEKSAALAASEERYRVLNTELEERVRKRTAELSLSNEELRQRELLFRLIFQHAPVGILWKRADLGPVYHLNPVFRRILDLPGDTLTDYAHLVNLVHPDDAARQTEMNRQIETGRIDNYTLEERFLLKDKRIVWGSLSVAVIRDSNGAIVQEIGILQEITARKKAEQELETTHKNLLNVSRQAGMAEVATGVLHSVGNVLNSVNVSALVVMDQLRKTRVKNLAKISAWLQEHQTNLAEFLTQDPKGRAIPEYLRQLADDLGAEREQLVQEVQSLHKNIEHIKDIVAMQQSYAKVSGVTETVSVSHLVEDALRMNASALAATGVDIEREYEAEPDVTTERHKVLQILVNLIQNARHACEDSGRPDKKLWMRIAQTDHRVKISVRDNGVGIPPENLTRIFAHGFTTRKNGHGFGLHSGALAAKELGGALIAMSEGPGHGATFTLDLPIVAGK